MSEIVVYWSNVHFNFATPNLDPAFQDFLNLTKLMSKESDQFDSTFVKFCPAVTDHLSNTFRLKSCMGYDITHTSDNLFYSDQKDDAFWKTFVNVRDKNTGLVSFYFPMFIFFTEEESLIMEYKHPIYANNSFSKNVQLVEGRYDIGKWFRNLDLAFFIKEKDRKVEIDYEDPIAYVKFLTEKKITLKKFYISDELSKIRNEMLNSRGIVVGNLKSKSVLKGMLKYYYTFKHSQYKSKILKEIKNNLLES
jgi:hypothetical protein